MGLRQLGNVGKGICQQRSHSGITQVYLAVISVMHKCSRRESAGSVDQQIQFTSNATSGGK